MLSALCAIAAQSFNSSLEVPWAHPRPFAADVLAGDLAAHRRFIAKKFVDTL